MLSGGRESIQMGIALFEKVAESTSWCYSQNPRQCYSNLGRE